MKIYAIGGYSRVEGNMTAVEVENEVIILDCGIEVERWSEMTEEERSFAKDEELIHLGVIPDDSILRDKEVKAIILSHGHMDHYFAVYWIARHYNCPIITTPFVYSLMKKDEYLQQINNPIIRINPGSSYKISENIEVNFIQAAHSIPQTVMIFLQTPEGNVLYANDWKFDPYPMLGKRISYKELKEYEVKVLISDCLRCDEERRTPSEIIAYKMLEDVFSRIDAGAVFLTTFSSHIARIKWMIDLSFQFGREPILLGRSLLKYMRAAEELNFVNLKGIRMYRKEKSIKKVLDEVGKNREYYTIICTGGQGEKGSILRRIAEGTFHFNFSKEDHVIFCNRIIPSPINAANRYLLESKLKEKGARILKDIHVSGHAAKEDLRDLIRITNPEYFIPTHAGIEKQAHALELALEEGYEIGKNCFALANGRVIEIEP